ncbi:hypothetical protein P3342_000019 [Pyrenophora teres f. teres]|nr:hypothetical protein P3342_000019 [Pyrenophora teres f. teres]
MTDNPAQTQESVQLAKPAEWALHVVVAALKFLSSRDAAVLTYTSSDGACMDVLNVLNRHEAHGEYEWPAFSGYGFAQAMRIRRALVNDVFVALEKTGRVALGVASTVPSSEKKAVCGIKAARKRKRIGGKDTHADLVDYESDEFLSDVMRTLLAELDEPISTYTDMIDMRDRREPVLQVAKLFYDGLALEWSDWRLFGGPGLRKKDEARN